MCTTTHWYWKACGHTIATECLILCKEVYKGCAGENPDKIEKKGRCPNCRKDPVVQVTTIDRLLVTLEGGWEMITEATMKEIRQIKL
ncbi:uncharacterized protein EAF01_010632 [Botrytis porri]|uniref:uncharacterized protein n=1 Tax=Botrytis porri TaxID=87229 RepID=UPI0019002ED3|nr:uncharacterized protein EAF01_010632 [Botrytis porri]KAF7890823.1 hypothetical protein EAF01_010632 [Botrytis porri]